jgi:transposase InsO family protein
MAISNRPRKILGWRTPAEVFEEQLRSLGSVADSYDNAMAEALNGSFKAELIEHHGPWRDPEQVERALVQWVGWYNTERLHSALDYRATPRRKCSR